MPLKPELLHKRASSQLTETSLWYLPFPLPEHKLLSLGMGTITCSGQIHMRLWARKFVEEAVFRMEKDAQPARYLLLKLSNPILHGQLGHAHVRLSIHLTSDRGRFTTGIGVAPIILPRVLQRVCPTEENFRSCCAT
jgi:hypothetical protein